MAGASKETLSAVGGAGNSLLLWASINTYGSGFSKTALGGGLVLCPNLPRNECWGRCVGRDGSIGEEGDECEPLSASTGTLGASRICRMRCMSDFERLGLPSCASSEKLTGSGTKMGWGGGTVRRVVRRGLAE